MRPRDNRWPPMETLLRRREPLHLTKEVLDEIELGGGTRLHRQEALIVRARRCHGLVERRQRKETNRGTGAKIVAVGDGNGKQRGGRPVEQLTAGTAPERIRTAFR